MGMSAPSLHIRFTDSMIVKVDIPFSVYQSVFSKSWIRKEHVGKVSSFIFIHTPQKTLQVQVNVSNSANHH